MLKVVKQKVGIPVFVMIRPRGGDFLYGTVEREVMMVDLCLAKEHGADGIVLAFDMVADPQQALEDVISLGCERLLTSGCDSTVLEGMVYRNTTVYMGGALRPPEFGYKVASTDRVQTLNQIAKSTVLGTSQDWETGRPGFDSGLYPNKSEHAPRRCTLGKGTLHDFPRFTQVDLGEVEKITGTIIQGRYYGESWVTSYKLHYGADGTSWTTYTDSDSSEKVFQGNTNAKTPVTNLLDYPIDARYVRFMVQSWHQWIGMRVEILGCSSGDCVVEPYARVDCGFPRITAEQCHQRRCCFDNSIPNTKFCFINKKKGERPQYTSLGCWTDRRDRAIPELEGTDPRLDGDYEERKNAVKKCYQVARSRWFTVFALQDGGQCFGSADAQNTYKKYGPSTACKGDGKGGGWANKVYQITG
ncbi:hypothetical protein Bbelb_304100 [Branchiostoma belcheri]|nr:hypothetical protein Bbelb_304100 [Branchiostoma belcheri]